MAAIPILPPLGTIKPLSKPPGGYPISTLPEETLCEILSYLPPESFSRMQLLDEGLNPIMFVCRQWRDTYEPSLYRTINLGSQRQLPSRRALEFLSMIENRPKLQSYPRSICLPTCNESLITIRNATKIIEYCKFLRKVDLCTELTPECWPLLFAIRDLPFLEDLSLSGPSMSLIFQHFNLLTLRRLSIKRYGAGKNASDPTSDVMYRGRPWVTAVKQRKLERLLPPDRYHTGSMTSLELLDPRAAANVSQHLLRWPARLEALSILWPPRDCRGIAVESYTSDNILKMISMHRQSLKYLKLYTSCRRDYVPNLSSFTSLQTLHVHASIFMLGYCHIVARNIAAPSLCRLIIDFEPEYGDKTICFTTTYHAPWLKYFVGYHKAANPASKLGTVFLKFPPKWKNESLKVMESLREELSRSRMALEWGTELN